MRLNMHSLEDQYYKELDECCDCNIREEGCSCPDFENWLEQWMCEQAESQCDF
jgi:hypothetical protein